MSFWLDDDEEYTQSQSQSAKTLIYASGASAADAGGDSQQQTQRQPSSSSAAFLFSCEQCGGHESYHDETAGVDVCSHCFAEQSQTQQGRKSEFDFSEVMSLAAKTKRGHIVQQHQRKSSFGATLRGKRSGGHNKIPMEDIDNSKPLPDLKSCLKLMTQVLKENCRHLGALLRFDPTQCQVLDRNVKWLWMSYLRSWMDAADYYGDLYPEVRFCFRDTFLCSSHRGMIIRALAYKFIQAQKQQQDKQTRVDGKEPAVAPNERTVAPVETRNGPINKAKKRSIEELDSEDDESDDEECKPIAPPSAESRTDTAQEEKDYLPGFLRGRNPLFYHIEYVIRKHKCHAPKDRRDAALFLKPGMSFMTALLWLAVARAGVSAHQIVAWIASGELPVMRAFHRLLSPEQQKEFWHLSDFFSLEYPPLRGTIESTASYLAIATGLSHEEAFWGQSSTDDTLDEEGDDNDKVKKRKKKRKLRLKEPPVRLLSLKSIPLVTAQLAMDVGLSQFVLKTALALMGCVKGGPQDGLPQSLPGAESEKLSSLAHVVAVLFCATQLRPPSEGTIFRRLLPSRPLPQTKSNGLGTAQPKHRRFVPWSEEEFRLLGNGPLLRDYLDFLEENVIMPSQTLEPEMVNRMVQACASVGVPPSRTDNKGNDREHYPHRVVRPSMPVIPLHTTQPPDPDMPTTRLRQAIFAALYRTTKRTPKVRAHQYMKKVDHRIEMNLTLPCLEPSERLWLEFLGRTAQIRTAELFRALQDILAG